MSLLRISVTWICFIMLASVWRLVRFVLVVLTAYLSILGNLLFPYIETYVFAATVLRYVAFQTTPTYRSLLYPQYKSTYVDRSSLPRPSGIHLVNLLQDLNISLPKPVPYPRLTVPPWTLLHPMFDFRLTDFL